MHHAEWWCVTSQLLSRALVIPISASASISSSRKSFIFIRSVLSLSVCPINKMIIKLWLSSWYKYTHFWSDSQCTWLLRVLCSSNLVAKYYSWLCLHASQILLTIKWVLHYARRDRNCKTGRWMCDVQFLYTLACPQSCTFSLTRSTESFPHINSCKCAAHKWNTSEKHCADS